MKRRYLITIRDFKGFLMEILCPIVLTLFGLLLSKLEMTFKSGPVEVSFEEIGKQNILYSTIDNNINLDNYFLDDYDSDIKSIKVDGFDGYTDKTLAIRDYIKKYMK